MRLDSGAYRADIPRPASKSVSNRGAKQFRRSLGILLVASQIGWSPAVAEEREEREDGWLDKVSEWLKSETTGTVPPKSLRNQEESRQSSPADGAANRLPTPGVVYGVVQDLIAETALLREGLGVHGVPPEPELQQERLPIHVLELGNAHKGLAGGVGSGSAIGGWWWTANIPSS